MQARINIPLLPLNDTSGLASIITAFTKPFTVKSLPPAKPINTALHVLPWCTTDAPMRRETLVALTDQTTCLRDVASLRDGDAQELIDGGMSEEDVRGILEFWAEEWVVD
jgi:hypothetical protein